MKKIRRTAVWALLQVLLIAWTNNLQAAVPREFKKANLEELKPTLTTIAPTDKYILYDISNQWNIMNTFFLDKINLKLNKCKADEEIVQPIKDEIINNPQKIAWYQEPVVIVLGFGVTFSAGLVFGFILAK